MINFNFAVKVGFSTVVVNETAVGMKVRHRNNGMYYGWIKDYLKNGKMLIETFDHEGFPITQQVDPEKFMVKNRKFTKMMGFVSERLRYCQDNIDSAAEQCHYEDYKFFMNKRDRIVDYYRAVLLGWDMKLNEAFKIQQ